MLGLVALGMYSVIGGLVCLFAAQFPNARAIRFFDKFTALLIGRRLPDTLAFQRYSQRMSRAAGLSFILMGLWVLAYAWADFDHWLSAPRSAVLYWGFLLGMPLLLTLPVWVVRTTRPKR